MNFKKILRKLNSTFSNKKKNNQETEPRNNPDQIIKRYFEVYTSQNQVLLDYYNNNEILINNKFKLIDVGCSGGFEDYWYNFKDIEAHGIDSVEEEIIKLNKNSDTNKYKYYQYYVCNNCDDKLGAPYIEDNYEDGKGILFKDTAAYRFQQIYLKRNEKVLHKKIYPTLHNPPEKLKLVKKVSIEDFCKIENIKNINYLKIDVYGRTADVLESCRSILDSDELLGVKAEVTLVTPEKNDFYLKVGNILNEKNFILMKIINRRYSPYYLPDKFLYEQPAQGLTGFDHQADFIFLKPPNKNMIEKLDRERFLKFLVLLELFDLSGFAIKMIKISENKFLSKDEEAIFLDLLSKNQTSKIFGKEMSYSNYIDMITKNSSLIFPNKED